MQTINQKRVEVAILLIISDSINFKAKIITRKKKKKKNILQWKGDQSSRRHNNYKHIWT